MKAYKAIFPALVLILSGCETVPSQEPDAAAIAEPVGQPSGPDTQLPPQNNQRTAATNSVRTDSLDYLSGQLLTMQEQIILIKADTAELKQNAQILLARVQMLNGQGVSADVGSPVASADPLTAQKIDQLTMQLNALLQQTESSYELVSSYTAKGQWVLIRFDRYTGETWLADKSRWNLLDESGELAPSIYEVQVHRADKDIKGYVAARIDQKSGQTWWLRENEWQNFQ